MEAKHRVKMHKVKKHWVAIGMTVLALTSLGAVKVSADETSPVAQADSTSQVQPSANKPVATIDTTASVDKLDNQAEESTNQSDTSSDTTVKASDLADSVPMDQAIPVAETNNGTANSDKQATPADQTQPQAQPTNTEQPATERLQVNPNLPKGTSYRGFHEVNGKTYYFNDQGDAVANQFVTYHYISPTLI
ncbi:KxYKxGKxW signal peptide domain-containing protein, partial [Streptococcus sobrinus]